MPASQEEALIRVLLRSHERRWETVEQALVMRELKDRHGLTDCEIARFMGHNQSWVSRRLSLLDALPEEILEMVQKGQISTWSATRVLVPMVRDMDLREGKHRTGSYTFPPGQEMQHDTSPPYSRHWRKESQGPVCRFGAGLTVVLFYKTAPPERYF